MRVVTTCTAKNYEDYAHRFADSWAHWPEGTELWWYGEGFVPEGGLAIEDLEELAEFKRQHRSFVAPSYLFDAVRFSNKVFAVIDALTDYDGIGVWCDADCVALQDIPAGYIESLLPAGCLIALFQRKGMYSETGFWIMDCRMPLHKAFLQTWKAWYTNGGFKTLGNWTDCETLDATIRRFEKLVPDFKVHNLSGEHSGDMHPMSKVELARYIDHCKGPRKAKGFSPENTYAVRATT